MMSYDGKAHHMMGKSHHMMAKTHHMMGTPIIFHHMMSYDGSLYFGLFGNAAAISQSQTFLWLVC